MPEKKEKRTEKENLARITTRYPKKSKLIKQVSLIF
jgi:hypothetical protein